MVCTYIVRLTRQLFLFSFVVHAFTPTYSNTIMPCLSSFSSNLKLFSASEIYSFPKGAIPLTLLNTNSSIHNYFFVVCCFRTSSYLLPYTTHTHLLFLNSRFSLLNHVAQIQILTHWLP